jgi:hypothetical protein
MVVELQKDASLARAFGTAKQVVEKAGAFGDPCQ